VLPPSLFEHPAAELSEDDSAQRQRGTEPTRAMRQMRTFAPKGAMHKHAALVTSDQAVNRECHTADDAKNS
jgi:hypothetical protein